MATNPASGHRTTKEGPVKHAYWTDGDGLVHILNGYHEMLCAGLYRINPDRATDLVPTCLQCIAAEGRREPGIVEWSMRKSRM